MLSTGDPIGSPPAQSTQRANWGIKENESGNRLKWLLQSLGFYSQESVDIRNSAMLYLNAREQAARPEFIRALGEVALRVWLAYNRIHERFYIRQGLMIVLARGST